jgi:hypothetical protein
LNFHKRFIGAGFLVLISAALTAQTRKIENLPNYDQARYHFGFTLAVNQMHYTIRPVEGLNFIKFDANQSAEINADSAFIYSIENQPAFGFTVGIVANLRLADYYDLRFLPSLSFGERTLNYRFLKYRSGITDLIEIDKNTPSTFIELPLHLKYKSKRLNNYRAYVLTGPNLRIDLASEAKKSSDAAEIQVKLNPYDLAYELGVGFDFYFEWFKFGTDLKMSYGLFDVLKRENNIYTDGIQTLRSKIFQISFTFE